MFEYFKKKREEKKQEKLREELPLIARVDLVKLNEERVKNMQLGDKSILARADYTKKLPTIRLFYVRIEKYVEYGTNQTKIGQIFGISSPFRLPREMAIGDAFKVVSYLSEMVEKKYNLEPASMKSVGKVSEILSDYGFERVEGYRHGYSHATGEYSPLRKICTEQLGCGKIDGVVDLFTIGGDLNLFEKSDLNDRYFDWFAENVTKQDIEQIYKNIRREYLLENINDNDEKLI